MRFIFEESAPDDGTYEIDWPSGTKRIRGEILGGLRQGEWVRWFEHGRRKEVATYHHGRLHGPVTRWFPTGLVREQLSYGRGCLHGPWAKWHPNGCTAIDGEWIDGRPHQSFLRFWHNGRPMVSGTFVMGEPMGEWRAWTEAGHLLYRSCFDRSRLIDFLPIEVLASLDANFSRARVA